MKSALLTLATCVIIFNPILVYSHHSRTNFLYDVNINLEGKVIDYKWRNPHVYIEIQTTDENEIWLIEGGTPSALRRQGWEKDAIKVGDNIMVVGNPDRNREKRLIYMDRINLENGKILRLKSGLRQLQTTGKPLRSETSSIVSNPAVASSLDFSGTWERGPDTFLTVRIFEPPSGWPLTQLGEEQLARYNEHNNPAYDCIERGLPFFSVHPYSLLWVRYEDRIEITLQNSNSKRTLYLNQHEHPDKIEPSLAGHSIARFEEDGSLLVDTIGFPATVRWGLAPGVDSSDQKRVKERYTLNKDGLGMSISLTFEDPVYLTEPVTVHGTYKKIVDFQFEPYECDLEAAKRNLSPPLKTP